MAGYGFNQRMEGFFTISNSDFNMSGDWSTYTHTEIGVGMRFNFGVTLSEFRPFAEVQLNGSSVEIDEIFVNSGTSRSVGKLSMSGLSAVAGGGTRYFFSSRAAASLHAKIHFGMNYDLELAGRNLDVNEDQDFNQWELGAGFTWYFGRRY